MVGFGFGKAGKAKTRPAAFFKMTRENQGTGIAKYEAPLNIDTVVIKGNRNVVIVRHECITFMKGYADKSLEELRLEDYMANRKSQYGAFLFGSSQFGRSFSFGDPQTQTISPGEVSGDTEYNSGREISTQTATELEISRPDTSFVENIGAKTAKEPKTSGKQTIFY